MLQLCILKYNFFLTLKHTSKRFKALECLWHTSTTKQVVQSSWVSEWFTLFTFILKIFLTINFIYYSSIRDTFNLPSFYSV
jgi:hypothetical protein